MDDIKYHGSYVNSALIILFSKILKISKIFFLKENHFFNGGNISFVKMDFSNL
jgi:hypothetical protein